MKRECERESEGVTTDGERGKGKWEEGGKSRQSGAKGKWKVGMGRRREGQGKGCKKG